MHSARLRLSGFSSFAVLRVSRFALIGSVVVDDAAQSSSSTTTPRSGPRGDDRDSDGYELGIVTARHSF